jgi:pimeloyl-ACP methyl ester carboxylesterase
MLRKTGWWVGALGVTLAGLGVAWQGIKQSEAGLTRRFFKLEGERQGEGEISALAFEPEQATSQTPAMIVAHGFSASKEIMQFIGVEIARRGLRAYLFDFAGHGAAPVPFVPPGGTDFSSVVTNNVRQVERIYNLLRRNFPKAEIGVLGHSMGSAAIANFAADHPELKATIPVSPVGAPAFSPENPRNLLVLVGQRDIPFSKDSSRELFKLATGQASPGEGDTIGKFKNGSARRLKILNGLDHISILYAPTTMREITNWLGQSFGLPGTYQNVTSERLRWTGLGLASSFAAFFPFASLLTKLLGGQSKPPQLQNWKFADHAGAMALVLGSQFASAVLLNKVKLPKLIRLQLGDYLAAFFGLSGLISWAGLLLFGRGQLKLGQISSAASEGSGTKLKSWVGLPFGLWLFVYLTLGRFSHRTWSNFSLTPTRARAMALISLSILPYFTADEFVFRRMGGLKGYFLSFTGKLGVIAALVLAVRLRPELSFLMILLPVMVLTFAVFGLCSGWQFRQNYDFVTSAVFQTLIFAWMVSILFPVI